MDAVVTSIHYRAGSVALDDTRVSPPSWTFEPWIIVSLLLAATIYLRGWWQLHPRLPRRFALWRLLAFEAGLFTLFLALSSPLHELGELLLQFHMVQHLLLMMVVAPLLLLGAPILPLLRGLPRPMLQYGVSHLFASPPLRKVAHWLTHPLLCLLAFTVSNVAWHVPTLYELALRSEFWHDVQHICFLGTGLLFWWPVVQPWPSHLRWPRWTMIPYLLVADIQNTALSAFLIFSERILYPTYAAVPRLWGISVLDDQAAAGAIMWVPGSVIFLVPVAVLAIRLLDSGLARSARDRSDFNQKVYDRKQPNRLLPSSFDVAQDGERVEP
jgi:cytochrome c oxidase assembly factor CtaG